MRSFCERRPHHRPAGVTAVVVALAHQPPALMRLALDVGLGDSLCASRELKSCSSPLGRDTGVDSAPQAAPDRLILHGDASPADAPFALEMAAPFPLFRRSAPTSAGGSLFPGEARRSDGRSRWFQLSPWRSGTGCRRSQPSDRSPALRTAYPAHSAQGPLRSCVSTLEHGAPISRNEYGCSQKRRLDPLSVVIGAFFRGWPALSVAKR